jgi:hypothetical protein
VDPRILQTNDRPEIRTDDEAWQPLMHVDRVHAQRHARKIAGATLTRASARGKPRKYAVSAARIVACSHLSTLARDRTVERLWKGAGKVR